MEGIEKRPWWRGAPWSWSCQWAPSSHADRQGAVEERDYTKSTLRKTFHRKRANDQITLCTYAVGQAGSPEEEEFVYTVTGPETCPEDGLANHSAQSVHHCHARTSSLTAGGWSLTFLWSHDHCQPLNMTSVYLYSWLPNSTQGVLCDHCLQAQQDTSSCWSSCLYEPSIATLEQSVSLNSCVIHNNARLWRFDLCHATLVFPPFVRARFAFLLPLYFRHWSWKQKYGILSL